MDSVVTIRRATADDAAGVVAVLNAVAAERKYSAIDTPWPVEEEARYISGLSACEAIHVACDDAGRIVGLQTLERFGVLDSMKHVGSMGTFLVPECRRRGIGRLLWETTLRFARASAYRKLVIYVRASNTEAQTFYRSLGFEECGRLCRQVVIDGVEDDEIVMEMFL